MRPTREELHALCIGAAKAAAERAEYDRAEKIDPSPGLIDAAIARASASIDAMLAEDLALAPTITVTEAPPDPKPIKNALRYATKPPKDKSKRKKRG